MANPSCQLQIVNMFENPAVIINKQGNEIASNIFWSDFCNRFNLKDRIKSLFKTAHTDCPWESILDDFNLSKIISKENFYLTLLEKEKRRFYSIKFLTLTPANGEEFLLIVLHELISEQALIHPFLKDIYRLNQLILENSRTGILIFNKKLELLYANDAFYSSDLNFCPCRSPIPIHTVFTQENIQKSFQKTINDGDTLYFLESSYSREGKRTTQDFKVFPLNYLGERVGALAFIKDKTEKHEKENQFLNNYRMTILGNLAGGIAHELNTPLGIVRLSAETVGDNLDSDSYDHDYCQKYLGQIIKAVDRMTGIVKQVTKFSREGPQGESTLCNINEIIRGCIIMYGKLLRSDDINLELKLDENIPHIEANVDQLQIVITDLINNARDSLAKIAPANGRKIVIETKDKSELEALSIAVYDNGRVIDHEAREKLFDSFFDPNNINENQRSQLGLGLSISHGIIKKHGGVFTVDSNPDTGTKFNILLPLKKLNTPNYE